MNTRKNLPMNVLGDEEMDSSRLVESARACCWGRVKE